MDMMDPIMPEIRPSSGSGILMPPTLGTLTLGTLGTLTLGALGTLTLGTLTLGMEGGPKATMTMSYSRSRSIDG